MDLTAVTLTELRYLLAVAETGHFGRAAQRCFVTQPTLSVQLKKLEENLGQRLIERGSKGAQLTPFGIQVAEHARAMLEHLQAIGDLARGQHDPLAGEFRLGLIPTLGPYLLPRLLKPLTRRFPALRLTVVEQLTATLLELVAHHEIDAALLALPIEGTGLQATPLFREPFWLLLPEGDPLARAKAVREEELKNKTVLLLAEGHCLREQALSVCHEAGSNPQADFRASSLETLRHLVAAGFGCTLVPALSTSRMQEAGVCVRPFHPPPPAREIGMVWRKTYPRAQAIQVLADFVRAHVPRSLVERLPDSGETEEGIQERSRAGAEPSLSKRLR